MALASDFKHRNLVGKIEPCRDPRPTMLAGTFRRLYKARAVPCRICGRPMSDPNSIALGMGPTHLNQKAPAVRNKVDRILREKGLTRDKAKRMFGAGRDRGTGHRWAGKPRESAARQPAERAGNVITGQVPFSEPKKPAAKPKKRAFLPGGQGQHTPQNLNLEQDIDRYVRDNVLDEHQGMVKKLILLGDANAPVLMVARQKRDEIYIRDKARQYIEGARGAELRAFIEDRDRPPADVNSLSGPHGEGREGWGPTRWGDQASNEAARKYRKPAKRHMFVNMVEGMAGAQHGRLAEAVFDADEAGKRAGLTMRERDAIRGDVQEWLHAMGWKPPGEAVAPQVQAKRRNKAASVGLSPLKVAPPQSVVRTGVGPNIVAVDVSDSFNDFAAFDAFLDMRDDQGRPMFDPVRGDQIIMEDPTGMFDPVRGGRAQAEFVQRAKARGIRVTAFGGAGGLQTNIRRRNQVLDAMDVMIAQKKGYGHVVAFRASDADNKVFGSKGNLLRRHLRRRTDSQGNVPEALVVLPGYRGRQDAEGNDIDSNAFGLGGSMLPARATGDVLMRRHRGPGKRATPAPKAADDPDSPASKHFKSGGDVSDAPADGLINAILRLKTRFTRDAFKNGNVSDTFFVTDNGRKPPKRWFVKKTAWPYPGAPDFFMKDDILNEAVAGEIMAALGGPGPTARFGNKPGDSPDNHWTVMDHVEEMNPGWTMIKFHARGNEYENGQDLILTHLFDYLINQGDRHPANYVTIEKNGRYRFVPVDNGGAFFAYEDRNPETDYQKWATSGKPRFVMDLAKDWSKSIGVGEADQLIDRYIDQLSNIDIQQIMELVERKNGDMSPHQQAMMRKMIDMWNLRLAKLKRSRFQISQNLVAV